MPFPSFETVMNEQQVNPAHPYALPRRQQVLILSALAMVAAFAIGILFLGGAILGHSEAKAQAVQPSLSRFIPPKQQLAALEIQSVPLFIFHDEVITDGYIASNGGFAPAGGNGQVRNGAPVLPGQSGDVLQAESDLATAHAQYEMAAKTEKRQHALYQTDGAALKDWQQSQADLATAAAAVASAKNRLRILGRSDREIAAFEQAASKSGSDATFSIGNGAHVWLVANVREEDAPKVHLGDDIEVKVPAYPAQTFKSKLGYMASLIDPNTHRLVVGALVPNPDGSLRANMSATVVIKGGPGNAAPAVPARAVIYEGDTTRVWVAGSDGSLALRDVKLGRTNGGQLEVTRGLSSGEKIVTSGALFIDRAANGE
ncbi:MAG TPA: efflux RND transporter periplasmic adaptor subunit [Rhizomicrobium sp.]|nr:efflux RND transporter periplasmic adaptor subunit [Rhizomicrobium sp.]